MFAGAKRKQQKQVRQPQCQEQCIDNITYYLSAGLSTFCPTTFLEIAVYPFSHFSHDRANWKVTSEAVGLYTLYSSEGEF